MSLAVTIPILDFVGDFPTEPSTIEGEHDRFLFQTLATFEQGFDNARYMMAVTPLQRPSRPRKARGKVQLKDFEVPAAVRYRVLAQRWLNEMGRSSNPQVLMSHPAFQAMVRMGREIAGFVLEDLEERPSLLVWLLPRVTGENSVPSAASGNVREMVTHWLRWGRRSGVLPPVGDE